MRPISDPATRIVYSTDNSIYQIEPHEVLLPKTAEELAAFVAKNARSKSPRPIVARGGGTGTNGQSLTDGLMVDLKRHMNQLLSVDVAAQTAWVQPGLVTANLNSQLEANELFWPPHTSTLNRATVGGMISTDAAGKGSLVYGRASRHVLEVHLVLPDGTTFEAKPLTLAEAELASNQPGPIGRLWRSLLELELTEGARYGLPELARGFSGYGIDRVRFNGKVDPIPLLCGAEGTLGIITAAKLRLSPIPKQKVLVVAMYETFDDALTDAVDLAPLTQPTAIEAFDETTLESGRSSPAWPALGSAVGDGAGAVLLLEYAGMELPSAAPVLAALERSGRSRTAAVISDTADQAAIWKVRADAVGLLAKRATGGPEWSARPTAMVEDCAVPVANMPRFIYEFRSLLDEFGLEYGMFGHADVGCVHVRPALDITNPVHEELVRAITSKVVDLVERHGGILWGEHGRGFRGEVASSFLAPSTIQIMRQVKTAFDPDDLMNPGKLYRPLTSTTPLVALDDPPLRGQANRQVPVELRRQFADAFACNGNGLCHHYDAAEVMCPSYKVTGDPALSPKGRADLIRAWLNKSANNAPDLAVVGDAIAANLHQCLSCSACSGHCPVEVDIPELKSQFLERYHTDHRRPASHAVLSKFESLAFAAARVPALAAGGAETFGRFLGLVDLPTPSPGRRIKLDTFDANDPTEVVVVPDVFSAALNPAIATKAVVALESVGYSTSVSKFRPSGKFDHVKGKRRAFSRAVSGQAHLIRSIADAGAIPVVIEPAFALLHRHEYPNTIADYPHEEIRFLDELLVARAESIPRSSDPQAVVLMGHCTERATAPTSLTNWATVMDAAGHSVETPDVGCCGMAGIFGHEKSNQEMSRALWDLSWSEIVRSNPTVVATGYSCRSQAQRMVGTSLKHPLEVVWGPPKQI